MSRDRRKVSALSDRLSDGASAEASVMSCPHDEAGLRSNDMREVEVCAECGLEIEGLTDPDGEVNQ